MKYTIMFRFLPSHEGKKELHFHNNIKVFNSAPYEARSSIEAVEIAKTEFPNSDIVGIRQSYRY